MLSIAALVVALGWEDMMRRLPPEAAAPPAAAARSQPEASPPSPPRPPREEAPPREAADSEGGPRNSPPPRSRIPKPEEQGPEASAPSRPASQPQLWKLADQSGQVWTHNDLAWLRQWVATRNQAIAASQQPAYSATLFLPSFSNCPGGVCPPGR